MIAASDLVRLFRQALEERWGYIWGKSGQVWTSANQAAAERAQTVQYGSRWIGRRVADCSGLFVWAYKEMGAEIYHGSNTIFKDYVDTTGTLYGEVEILPGTAVFQVKKGRRTHIGLYVGGGKVIEARGTQSGVIESDLDWWDEWGTLKDVDYSDVTPEVVMTDMPALRKGDSGLTVKYLQDLLAAAGYEPGKVDGIYGAKTKTAVEAFQRANGLDVDGIAGKMTMAALRKGDPAAEETPEDDEPVLWDDMTDKERIANLNERLLRLEGGDKDGS